MDPQSSLFRRYKWDDLTDPEKEAVKDALGIAVTRSGVGLGAVLTAALFITNARRGRPPLPSLTRYGSLLFFSIAGAYGGFMSGGPLYAQRVLTIPNSRLAEDLRVVVGDWQARVPSSAPITQQVPVEGGTPPEDVGPPPPVRRKGNNGEDGNRDGKSLAYWLGLTKS